MRGLDRAALATAMRGGTESAAGWPYPSLVLVALDHDGSPLLLLSGLADHTRNIAEDARAGLLFDGTAGLASPLTGARVSVLGRLARSDEPHHRARFLARHPEAALYAGFGDFALYRLSVERAHLVAGFGLIHWIGSDELLIPKVAIALAEQEAGIVASMNRDHAAAIQGMASPGMASPGGPAGEGGWTVTGVDPDGCDLRLGGAVARIDFDRPLDGSLDDPGSLRAAFDGLVRGEIPRGP